MKLFKAKKGRETIVKSEEGRPPDVPGSIPDSYGHPSRSLDDFALSDEARARITERRKQNREDAERLRQELGFGPLKKNWWE